MASPDSTFIELVEENSQSLHQMALTVLEIKDNVDNGFFDVAEQMCEHLADSFQSMQIAMHGLELMQAAQKEDSS